MNSNYNEKRATILKLFSEEKAIEWTLIINVIGVVERSDSMRKKEQYRCTDLNCRTSASLAAYEYKLNISAVSD